MFDNIYLREHQMTLVSAAPPEDRVKLHWADGLKYITLSRTPQGRECFTQNDLEQANMWWKKLHTGELDND